MTDPDDDRVLASASPRAPRQFGVPLLLEVSREVEGALPRASFERTAEDIRRMQLGWGEVEIRDAAIVWASKAGPPTTVRVNVVDDRTRIVVHRDIRPTLLGLAGGSFIAGILGLIAALLMWGGLHSPLRLMMAFVMGGTVGGYPIARMQARAEVQKHAGVLERLANRLADEVRGALATS